MLILQTADFAACLNISSGIPIASGISPPFALIISTYSGITIAYSDIVTSKNKEKIVEESNKEVKKILMETAVDLNHDKQSQGWGRISTDFFWKFVKG